MRSLRPSEATEAIGGHWEKFLDKKSYFGTVCRTHRMAFSNSYAILKTVDPNSSFFFKAKLWLREFLLPFLSDWELLHAAADVKQCKNPLFNLMHMLLCHQETNQFYAILWPSYKKLDSQALKNHWKTLFFFGFKASKASYKIGQGY